MSNVGTGEYYRGLLAMAGRWPEDWTRGPDDAEIGRIQEEVEQRLVVNEKDGSQLLLIPAGEFEAGGPFVEEGGGSFKVTLPAYYLGVHPITNAQYARFVTESGYAHAGSSASGKADEPVVEVSWDDAAAYCKWAELRLPTELEWEKGARGTDGREYPWGPTWQETLCRNDKNKGGGKAAGTWQHSRGTGPWGGYQMAGNVWEWCADSYEKERYEKLKKSSISTELASPRQDDDRVLRGGSWRRDNPSYFRCAYRFRGGPNYRRADYGFRPARTA